MECYFKFGKLLWMSVQRITISRIIQVTVDLKCEVMVKHRFNTYQWLIE